MGRLKRLLKRKHSSQASVCNEHVTDDRTNLSDELKSHGFETDSVKEKTDSAVLPQHKQSDVENESVPSLYRAGKAKNHHLVSAASNMSDLQRKGARATENLASGVVNGNGSLVLWHFISSLGPKTEHSLSKGLLAGGATISGENVWQYELRQGQGEKELNRIRNQMNGRLYRAGGRVQGGGWTRLLLGEEYSTNPSKKQSHELSFHVTYCVCLKCRVASAKCAQEVDEMDQMLQDAENGIGFEDNIPEGNEDPKEGEAVEDLMYKGSRNKRLISVLMEGTNTLVQWVDLPSENELEFLAETLQSQEFELGTVSKISAKTAKVKFSRFSKQLLRTRRYFGPLSPLEISNVVSDKAKEYYGSYKGKTLRRFYICGSLYKISLEGVSVIIFQSTNQPTKDHEGGKKPVGVLLRRQTVSVFVGNLALEDSFGSFIHTEKALYLGFSNDSEGAQSIYNDGSLGEARRLGINELRSHLQLREGQVLALKMY
ncbi:hypothetical protein BWQ96_00966 [Gracilariopsis chorda]|uniref:Uncharacterized protein n=1 Tax=Gracilariopsis chorda TaxID=448386 RepID=A0A2V3J598_9FLOR|nr:hypothetical protein BWQ96_00966 [Gracilariopsis chorda]|eukprot:PXF49177.1 hypothetical protein BWQ96_00966 [Gracilariopsis chorda]